MINELKEEYNKNPNRTFTLFSFVPYIIFFSLAIFATIFTNESIAVIFIIIGFCAYFCLRIWNMYMILKTKNRSLMWMIPGFISFAWIGFIILICLNKRSDTNEPKIKVFQKTYNVNGKCTITNKPCEMVKNLGICNCEMCKLNHNN